MIFGKKNNFETKTHPNAFLFLFFCCQQQKSCLKLKSENKRILTNLGKRQGSARLPDSTSPLNTSPRLLGLVAGPAPVPAGSRADLSSVSDPEWVTEEAISEGRVSGSVFSLLRYPLSSFPVFSSSSPVLPLLFPPFLLFLPFGPWPTRVALTNSGEESTLAARARVACAGSS